MVNRYRIENCLQDAQAEDVQRIRNAWDKIMSVQPGFADYKGPPVLSFADFYFFDTEVTGVKLWSTMGWTHRLFAPSLKSLADTIEKKAEIEVAQRRIKDLGNIRDGLPAEFAPYVAKVAEIWKEILEFSTNKPNIKPVVRYAGDSRYMFDTSLWGRVVLPNGQVIGIVIGESIHDLIDQLSSIKNSIKKELDDDDAAVVKEQQRYDIYKCRRTGGEQPQNVTSEVMEYHDPSDFYDLDFHIRAALRLDTEDGKFFYRVVEKTSDSTVAICRGPLPKSINIMQSGHKVLEALRRVYGFELREWEDIIADW